MTKEKFAWNSLAVPLVWLAELDNVPAPNALTDAFGDRYLYRYNSIFAGIRDAAIDFGYRFSADDTPLWRDYQSLGLVALQNILSTKTIPYLDTAITIRRLIDSNPAARLPPGFITGNVKRNYAFHESAHCVAHSVIRGIEAEVRAVAPYEPDRVVLEAILAESFANTVEALGSVFRHMPVSDGVFYRLNSYWACNQEREAVLNRAGAGLGAEARFRLLFLSFFEANLAMAPAADSTYQRIAECTGCSADLAGLAREIAGIAFGLNASFRDSTTPAYFELLGRTREFNDLATAGWLGRACNQTFVRQITQVLWEAAGKV